MSIPLVYIDQNIIGLQLLGHINLSKRDDMKWVYSKEHFAEIKRADDPEKYLNVLNEIGAKMLDLILDENWKITGEARLIEDLTPFENYQNYIEAIGNVEFDETIFDPFQVWMNGGRDEGPLKELSDNLANQVLQLTSDLPYNTTGMPNKIGAIKPELDSMVDDMISNGNDIKKTRAALGDKKGTIGAVSEEHQIAQIWEIISPTMEDSGMNCDQFFGFDPIDNQGYELWPVYLGIVGCNAVMDILGFQAEKKCRKISKIHNVRSDAGHIGMGAYCSAILSEDKRLVKRAKAIYEYKNIVTSSILIEKDAKKSIQPTANVSAD
ncbi:hypothetical protein [Pseudoalteromonas sp. P1-11]|uniref:hypothetical protein n=1 Tax=Pseudoalteromonas sp. P1-11 TaxID=1715254 RepID=UPI0006DBE712|nr:hypothetical protein [Pseudoalteromonas sp. P1-11]KPV96391.1 hypothetical protein AN390_03915 [Pseudoalteromonas sp. P1-11]